jgi:hypothetical protein
VEGLHRGELASRGHKHGQMPGLISRQSTSLPEQFHEAERGMHVFFLGYVCICAYVNKWKSGRYVCICAYVNKWKSGRYTDDFGLRHRQSTSLPEKFHDAERGMHFFFPGMHIFFSGVCMYLCTCE